MNQVPPVDLSGLPKKRVFSEASHSSDQAIDQRRRIMCSNPSLRVWLRSAKMSGGGGGNQFCHTLCIHLLGLKVPLVGSVEVEASCVIIHLSSCKVAGHN